MSFVSLTQLAGTLVYAKRMTYLLVTVPGR
jgi:hypothetical protein